MNMNQVNVGIEPSNEKSIYLLHETFVAEIPQCGIEDIQNIFGMCCIS